MAHAHYNPPSNQDGRMQGAVPRAEHASGAFDGRLATAFGVAEAAEETCAKSSASFSAPGVSGGGSKVGTGCQGGDVGEGML